MYVWRCVSKHTQWVVNIPGLESLGANPPIGILLAGQEVRTNIHRADVEIWPVYSLTLSLLKAENRFHLVLLKYHIYETTLSLRIWVSSVKMHRSLPYGPGSQSAAYLWTLLAPLTQTRYHEGRQAINLWSFENALDCWSMDAATQGL